MNIIFYDNIKESKILKINKCLYDMDYTNYTNIKLCRDCNLHSYIKSTLEKENAGSFIIITENPEKYNKYFPNNTLKVTDEINIDKVCKCIIYTMSNFGREYKNMSKIFVCSDSHFYHENIIKYCNRPYSSVDEMNADMIEKWNSVVGSDDIIIHLGDFCFGGKEKIKNIFNQLNGKIDLVMGNHDKLKIKDYYEIGFHRVYDRPILFDNFYIMSHVPVQWIKDGDVYANIYGHVHNIDIYKDYTKNTFCACVERTDFKPIQFDIIKDIFLKENSK